MTDTNTTPAATMERALRRRDKGRKEVEKRAQALEKLDILYIPHSRITPNDYNPNRQSEHDFELLLRSMDEDGFTQCIVVVKDPKTAGNFIIVDGEHRWRASQVLNERDVNNGKKPRFPEIPVAVVPMTPEQARIATLRHNRARGSEDVELTAQVLRDLQQLGALDWAADSLMMDDVELNRLLEEIPAPEALAGEEYGEAWAPDAVAPQQDLTAEGSTQAREDDRGTYKQVEAMTPSAIAHARKREQALAEAKTQEEKAAVRKESDLYRISLMFSGEEAKVIKQVLGDAPAVKLLALCMAELYPVPSA